jgi:RimJ/RimL family protein N-acetyltransferase
LSGQGILSQAIGKFVGFCFLELGLDVITAQAMSSNIASVRVLQKNGFRETCLANSGKILAGEDSPRVNFALSQQDSGVRSKPDL